MFRAGCCSCWHLCTASLLCQSTRFLTVAHHLLHSFLPSSSVILESAGVQFHLGMSILWLLALHYHGVIGTHLLSFLSRWNSVLWALIYMLLCVQLAALSGVLRIASSWNFRAFFKIITLDNVHNARLSFFCDGLWVFDRMLIAFHWHSELSQQASPGRMGHCRTSSGLFPLPCHYRLHSWGERGTVARVSLLHKGVPEAQWPCAPHPHPHPREALQVSTVFPGLCREEHADCSHQNSHWHQGLQVPVLHEELFHLREPQGAHPPPHRCAHAGWGAGSAVVELSKVFLPSCLPIPFVDLWALSWWKQGYGGRVIRKVVFTNEHICNGWKIRMGDQTLALDTSNLSKEKSCIPQSQETCRP